MLCDNSGRSKESDFLTFKKYHILYNIHVYKFAKSFITIEGSVSQSFDLGYSSFLINVK